MMDSEYVDQTVNINVGGKLFQCYSETLKTFPESKLAKLEFSRSCLDCSKNEYFFDRNSDLFGIILDAYRKGSIHIPKDTCGTTFKAELEFWELSPRHVAPCCWEALYSSDGNAENMNSLIKRIQKDTFLSPLTEEKRTMRETIWLILDEPNSSRLAFMWGLFMSVGIIVSIILTGIQTLPEFWGTFTDKEMQVISKMIGIVGLNNISDIQHMKPNPKLYFVDAGFNMLFTIEIIIYFVVCPSKRKFVTCTIRMGTLIGYLSFWVTFPMELNLEKLSSIHVIHTYTVFKYLVILKVFRLFYITRHVPAFKLIALTFRKSKEELWMVGFLLSIMVCLFGFVMYVAEITHNDKMNNAFNAMYWALITLTTVGYGHYTPVTPFGHVVAGACAVCGVLVLALPVGVIASKFYKYYSYYKYAVKHIRQFGIQSKSVN